MATEIAEVYKNLHSSNKVELTGINALIIEFDTKTYKNPMGEARAVMRIRVTHDGEIIHFVIPNAYRLDGRHDDAFLRHAMILQKMPWRYGQFGLDPRDNELSLSMILILSDADLTGPMLNSHVDKLKKTLEDSWEPLSKTRETGVIELPRDDVDKKELLERLVDALPADFLEKAVHLAREREKALIK